MAENKILVTGATGATGGKAIKTLLELNIPVRALVHLIDARSEQLRAQGMEIVHGDLSDFGAVNAALKGVTGAYFVYPIQVPGILEATAFFAQAALEQGVGAIMNMLENSARMIAKSHAAQNHWIAERLLDRSGIPVIHLRTKFPAALGMPSPQLPSGEPTKAKSLPPGGGEGIRVVGMLQPD